MIEISESKRDGCRIAMHWGNFRVDQVHDILQIDGASPLAGKTIAESELESRYRVRILGLLRRGRRGEERTIAPASQMELLVGDVPMIIS